MLSSEGVNGERGEGLTLRQINLSKDKRGQLHTPLPHCR